MDRASGPGKGQRMRSDAIETNATANDIDLDAAATELEGRHPAEILAWAAERFAPRIALSTGFGVEGCVLVDFIARARLPIEVFTLDTGLLFPETYDLWRRLEARYGLRIRAVRPDLTVRAQGAVHGERLWERDPDRCCALRKVEPLREALRPLDAWVTAIRRDQTRERATARAVEQDDRFGLVKVNPLLSWTSRDVWNHVATHDIPYSPLHGRGYPSIGCSPCTTPVAAGEDPRAGRWRGRKKTECGLHSRRSAALHLVAPDEPVADRPAPATLYPAFLKLAGRRVLLVGGGKVAAAKLQGLLRAGADVTVVSPSVHSEIERSVRPERAERRPFRDADVDGAWLVIAAATPEVNRQVAASAEARRVFVIAVDDPAAASAYGGGVVRRGGVTVAVSTDGAAPALAGLLREGLEAVLPDELEAWSETARALRAQWRRDAMPQAERRPLLLRALNRLYMKSAPKEAS
jgi:phosphoadenylyl-sulfate reductase (thioredoxin)